MFDSAKVIEKAKHSSFWLWVLNQTLYRMVPFNRPHRFQIIKIGDHELKTLIPYRHSNFNHIRGLHACALATLSEFATGFLLLSRLDINKYRLIMQRIEMDYHYQGKMDAHAEFKTSDAWFSEMIMDPLKSQEAVIVPCIVKIHDVKGNHLTTGKVFWQIKDWARVKTKA
jgi:hypothetical protein